MRTAMRTAAALAAVLAACPIAAARADEPPEWAIGHFVGDNPSISADADLTVSPRGAATLVYHTRWGRTTVHQGSYRHERLVFPSATYALSRTDRGVRLTNTRDRDDRMNLDRVGRPPLSGNDGWRYNPPGDRWDRRDRLDRVPDWAVGAFVGDNGYLKVDAEITIERNGRAVRIYRSARGRTERVEGRYERGRLVFGRTEYELSRTGRGIKVTNTRERRDWMGLDRSDRWLEHDRRR